MTQNVSIEIEGSCFYDNDPGNCHQYGCLYTWDAAIKACPNGWRLPNDDDWFNLFKAAGGMNEAGGLTLVEGDFRLMFGGSRSKEGEFCELGEWGHYWTSTESSKSHAFCASVRY